MESKLRGVDNQSYPQARPDSGRSFCWVFGRVDQDCDEQENRPWRPKELKEFGAASAQAVGSAIASSAASTRLRLRSA